MSETRKTNVALRPSELVIAAIHNLEEKNGSSPSEIINFISNKYSLDTDKVKGHVEKALKRGVCFGVLSQNRGLYRLLDMNTSNSQALRKRNKNKKLGGKSGKSERKNLGKKKTASTCRVGLPNNKYKLMKNPKVKVQKKSKGTFRKKNTKRGRKPRS